MEHAGTKEIVPYKLYVPPLEGAYLEVLHVLKSIFTRLMRHFQEKMLRTVRKVADAENRCAFLNMEFNGSAKSTEKAP